MNITHRGVPPEGREWHGRCHTCRSTAVATGKEMTHPTDDFREGGRFSWEVCPVCKCGDPASGYGGMLFYEQKQPAPQSGGEGAQHG